jgi:DNA mismatch endonuclease (patch repair protein)
MSRIKGSGTSPERAVRRILHRMGFRFRLLTGRRLIGKPDIVLPKHRTVVFVHGCFWHRHPACRFCYTPKSRIDFWQKKFDSNVVRDSVVQRALKKEGWRIVVVWECEVANPVRLQKKLERFLSGPMTKSAGKKASPGR